MTPPRDYKNAPASDTAQELLAIVAYAALCAVVLTMPTWGAWVERVCG